MSLRNQVGGKAHEHGWAHGDYHRGVVVRFILLLLLWVFYGLIPHKLPLSSLLITTAIFGGYAAFLFWKRAYVNAWLMTSIAILNTLLIPLLAAEINTIFVVILIYLLLILDIATEPL